MANCTLKKVMAPAIQLAREGYALTWEEAADLHDADCRSFPSRVACFSVTAEFYKQERRFRQPELAQTLERIAEKPDDFYHGSMAREIAAAVQKGGGLITADDLAHYEVKEREPVRGTYRGYEVISAPPPSSGGTVLIEISEYPGRLRSGKMGDRSAQSIHLHDRGLSAGILRSRGVYGRSGFRKDPGRAIDR